MHPSSLLCSRPTLAWQGPKYHKEPLTVPDVQCHDVVIDKPDLHLQQQAHDSTCSRAVTLARSMGLAWLGDQL